jgi:hypothetical protein
MAIEHSVDKYIEVLATVRGIFDATAEQEKVCSPRGNGSI